MGKKQVSKSPETRIRYHQEQMEASEMSFVEHAHAAGKILISQKKSLDYGKFDDWCKEHWKRSKRTAVDYMKLANHLSEKDVQQCSNLAEAKKLIPPENPAAIKTGTKENTATKSKSSSPKKVEGELIIPGRQPGDESEADGEDPIPPVAPAVSSSEESNSETKTKARWEGLQKKAIATANALQRAIDDLAEERPNRTLQQNAIGANQEVISRLREWK